MIGRIFELRLRNDNFHFFYLVIQDGRFFGHFRDNDSDLGALITVWQRIPRECVAVDAEVAERAARRISDYLDSHP